MKHFWFYLREKIKFRIFRPMLLGIGRGMARFATVPDRPVMDNRYFAWTRTLEAHWTEIRNEFLQLKKLQHLLPGIQDIQQEQQVLNQDQNWKTFFLYGFGEKAELNCRLCPRTTDLLEDIPGMKTAFFSVISAGKHIPAHKGLFKGIIRSHLGLIVPGRPGACRMRVAEETHPWEPGKVIVFDDTYDHEVWNDSHEARVVLLLDVERPFRPPWAGLNRAIIRWITHSSYVREAQEKHRQWEVEFHRNLGFFFV
ncbi:aspartyl/asparaginyl beta-hydroxylase domain-containing protein [Robiginitalea sp. M366]|uniref:aspartyl/asparaginyl beta-hydroxylase domain-containing protein n=1 Tax=Robiginitalea aestuariiviva TaxID=3036903 RepID=UPI00240E572B|nr:aspartyl/asparaginyl beta-hydroxylase domain-containing protein [Robiginitalea aestuariiviva]MDG1572333.1 aspartyl/asparaginyl beta-hydroxylase domain-containing protein [Robiginitalea aestuariiviva]